MPFQENLLFVRKNDSIIIFDSAMNICGKINAGYVFPFNSKYIKGGVIQKDGNTRRSGLFDCEGRMLIAPIFDDIYGFEEENLMVYACRAWGGLIRRMEYPDPTFKKIYNSNIYVTVLGDKYGLLDSNFMSVVGNIYDWIWDYYYGILIVSNNDKWGLIDLRGREIAPCVYDSIGDYYGSKIYRYNNMTKSRYVTNRFSNSVFRYISLAYTLNEYKELQTDYTNAKGLSEGLIRVKKDGEWGYIDTLGREVIPMKYSSAKNFNRGIAEVELKGKKLKIYKDGTVVK